MALEHLTGTTYGPFTRLVSSEKVEEFVAVTGDDPDRWAKAAPPGYAGALLFVVAPAFLRSPQVAGHTAVLIHADQAFTWGGPLSIGATVDVVGRVERVRSRGPVDFVTFTTVVTTAGGPPLVESTATFLLGSEPLGERPAARREPPVEAAAGFDGLRPPVDGVWPPVVRSASRLDLVRYAGASGDFNPIHFDHEAARSAGLAGTVVHGLLMAAWMLQPVAGLSERSDPISAARFRFRDPLHPAEAARLAAGIRPEDGAVGARLSRVGDGADLVTARITLREA
jgi:acyl dehydratase